MHLPASFIQSASHAGQLPDHGLCEVAVAGRSNVGKSTLLGALLGRPKLVRTSRTPGRTQLLNLFAWGERLALVDLPGYGYAKLSQLQRRQMQGMVQDYVSGREVLRGLVLVLDGRRDAVTPQDAAMVRLVLKHGRALLLAVTKMDCVPKPKRLHQAQRLLGSLGVPVDAAVLCSGHSGEGVAELRARLLELAA